MVGNIEAAVSKGAYTALCSSSSWLPGACCRDQSPVPCAVESRARGACRTGSSRLDCTCTVRLLVRRWEPGGLPSRADCGRQEDSSQRTTNWLDRCCGHCTGHKGRGFDVCCWLAAQVLLEFGLSSLRRAEAVHICRHESSPGPGLAQRLCRCGPAGVPQAGCHQQPAAKPPCCRSWPCCRPQLTCPACCPQLSTAQPPALAVAREVPLPAIPCPLQDQPAPSSHCCCLPPGKQRPAAQLCWPPDQRCWMPA